MNLIDIAAGTKSASFVLSSAPSENKNKCLQLIHKKLVESKNEILLENKADLENASLSSSGVSPQLLKRLDLSTKGKFDSMVQGVLDIAALDDPVGKVQLARQLDDGLQLYRVSCPVGVLLIIFEARPEVVIQISCLAIKSGNAVILKGGKEAHKSNTILFKCVQSALEESQLIPPQVVQLVASRQEISLLLGLDKYIDLVIPRGSNELVRHVQENTRIPVLGHADGICSVYIDNQMDLNTAIRVVVDGKINYPAACNATEKVLIHKDILSTALPPLVEALIEKGVAIRMDDKCLDILSQSPLLAGGKITKSTPQDYETEFLDLIIAIKSIDSLKDAITHINEKGSHHTDCIVTTHQKTAESFMSTVDSAGVYWNASTRFADGFRYGFGAEIGVSTNKTHARGPVGLEGLLIYKYRVYGNGHVVGEYNDGIRSYHRKDLALTLPNVSQ